MKTNRIYILLAFILLLGLALRIALSGIFLDKGLAESFEYNEIAKNIVSGKGYRFDYLGATYRSFAPPLYAILIAVLYKFAGTNIALVIYLQIILSALTTFVIFFVAKRLTSSEYSAVIASILCSFHPGLILYSVKKIHALSLDALMFSLTLLSIMKLRERPSPGKAAICGLAFGLAILSRPSIVVILPIVIILLYSQSKARFSIKGLNIALLVFIMAIPTSLWTIRNYVVHRKFIVNTTCDTEVFWRGNNPNATGTSYVDDKTTVLESDKILYNKLIGLSELEKRSLFREEAMKFIKGNPIKFLKLYFKKLYYFWWFSPTSGLHYPSSYFLIYKVFYSFVLPLALIGLAYSFRKNDNSVRRNALLLLLFLISLSLFQSLCYIEGRHRWGLEPILMIFSAIGIAAFARKAKEFICSKQNRG